MHETDPWTQRNPKSEGPFHEFLRAVPSSLPGCFSRKPRCRSFTSHQKKRVDAVPPLPPRTLTLGCSLTPRHDTTRRTGSHIPSLAMHLHGPHASVFPMISVREQSNTSKSYFPGSHPAPHWDPSLPQSICRASTASGGEGGAPWHSFLLVFRFRPCRRRGCHVDPALKARGETAPISFVCRGRWSPVSSFCFDFFYVFVTWCNDDDLFRKRIVLLVLFF